MTQAPSQHKRSSSRPENEQHSSVSPSGRRKSKRLVRHRSKSLGTNDAAHSPHSKEVLLFKTELCRNFTKNRSCPFGADCHFAHGEHELREAQKHPKHKTEKCKFFHTDGFCPFGTRCHFLHNEAESQELTMTPPSFAESTSSTGFSLGYFASLSPLAHDIGGIWADKVETPSIKTRSSLSPSFLGSFSSLEIGAEKEKDTVGSGHPLYYSGFVPAQSPIPKHKRIAW